MMTNARSENLRGRITRVAVTVHVAAFFIVTSVARVAPGDGGCRNCEKQPSAQAAREAPRAPADDLNLGQFPLRPLHGGQVTATRWHYFEVVYMPSETRIYVYSPSQRLLNASGVRGETAMQVNGNPRTFRYPVQAVADPSGFAYLKADVDVSRVRDGDMHVTFDLRDLPNRQESTVRFTQTFALTRPPAHVPPQAAPAPPGRARVVPVNITRADEPAIRAQGICPVMNQPLGSHGAPIKVLVDGRPVFVCCQGCVPKVAQVPDFYLEKVYGNRFARPSHFR